MNKFLSLIFAAAVTAGPVSAASTDTFKTTPLDSGIQRSTATSLGIGGISTSTGTRTGVNSPSSALPAGRDISGEVLAVNGNNLQIRVGGQTQNVDVTGSNVTILNDRMKSVPASSLKPGQTVTLQGATGTTTTPAVQPAPATPSR